MIIQVSALIPSCYSLYLDAPTKPHEFKIELFRGGWIYGVCLWSKGMCYLPQSPNWVSVVLGVAEWIC